MNLMQIFIFIDYNNLVTKQKENGIRDVVSRVVAQVEIPQAAKRIRCEARVYGGWYEDVTMTKRAQEVAVEIQNDFPAIIRTSNTGGHISRVESNASLAVSLLEDPANHLFNTYRRKDRPSSVRVKSKSQMACSNVDCQIPILRKAFKKGVCSVPACAKTASMFIRTEQKLVDTMLTCDVVYSTELGCDRIAIVSSDDDFLPAIRTSIIRGAHVIRFNTKQRRHNPVYVKQKQRLIEKEL